MFNSKFTVKAIILGLALLAAGAWHAASATSSAAAQEAKDSPLKALLKERLAVLKEIESLIAKEYQSGVLPYGILLKARRDLLNAELDLCESNAEKIAVLEKTVALAMEQEKVAEQLVKAREAPATDRSRPRRPV